MDTSVLLSRPVRAAGAAAVAWLVVSQMGGLADNYPYYAPMGAVAAVTASVVASMRESVQTVAAMAIGVALATAATFLPTGIAILLVAGGGVLVKAWPVLGSAGAWTPITAIFVLIIGGDDPLRYAAAYIGLFTLGAAIGFVSTVLAGPLPIADVDRSLATLRDRLAEQLDKLADGLDGTDAPTPDQWDERREDLEPIIAEVHDLIDHATAARRVNWRAKRWQEVADHQYQAARMLSQLTNLVDDITDLLVEEENAYRNEVVLGPPLRPKTSNALSAAADVLRELADGEADPEARHRAWEALEELIEDLRSTRTETGDDLLSASSIVTALRRFLQSAETTVDTPHAYPRRFRWQPMRQPA